MENVALGEERWALTRKRYIIAGVVLLLLSLGSYLLVPVLRPYPTCNDLIQNGDEAGIDCGGACQMLCKNQYVPVSIGWKLLRPTGADGMYDIAVMLHNENESAVPVGMKVLVQVIDTKNNPVYEEIVPVVIHKAEDLPIYRLNQQLQGEGLILRTSFVQDGIVPYVPSTEETLRDYVLVTDSYIDAYAETPSASIKVLNRTQRRFPEVPVFVYVSNVQGEIVGIGSTVLYDVLPEESRTAVITWRSGVLPPQVTRVQAIIVGN